MCSRSIIVMSTIAMCLPPRSGLVSNCLCAVGMYRIYMCNVISQVVLRDILFHTNLSWSLPQ